MSLIAALSFVLAFQGPGTGQITKPALPAPPASDKVIAIVDGFPIKASDAERQLWDWHGYEVLQELIVNQIVDAKAAGANLTATDAEIQAAYLNQIETLKPNVPTGSDVDTFMKERGGNRSRLWLGARREVLISKLVLASMHLEDFVSVSTILVRPASEAVAEVTAAISKSNELYAKLQKGESWNALFPKYNADPNIPNNGLIGYVMLSKFPASTQKELSALKPGQYTKPVQTQFGFQVFRLEKRAKDDSPGEIAGLKNQYVLTAKRGYIDALVKAAKVTRNL